MSKNLPKHPLEKWAEITVSKSTYVDTPMKTYFSTILGPMTKDDRWRAHTWVGALTTATFAWELLEGKGNIVRIAPELLDDVLSSKVDEDHLLDQLSHLRMPWPMFAVELGAEEDYCAIVLTTDTYVLDHVPTIVDYFDLDASIVDAMVRAIRAERSKDTEAHMAFGLIPSKQTIRRQAAVMAEKAVDEAESQGSFLAMRGTRPGKAPSREEQIDLMASLFAENMPFDLHQVETLLPGRAKDTEPTMALISFMCAENAKTHTSYVPGPAPKNPAKARRRSKATLHECGFEWTVAYREYRRAKSQARALGGSVRPHTRRGHYHHFWCGPRDGERTLVCHWIPPILVKGRLGVQKNQGHEIRPAQDTARKGTDAPDSVSDADSQHT